MTLSKWREDLSRQLHPLVHGAIVHPSIPIGSPHRSILVINGELDEEVQREIDDFNRQSDNLGTPDRKVEVIVRGQLFNAFKELQTDFWATNLTDLKTYLELFLEDGRGQLPKEKVCRIFQSALPLNTQDERQPTQNEVGKMIAGCAIICASAISAFTNAKNHLAEFEAWTIYWAHTLSVLERWKFPVSTAKFALDLALDAMYSSLERLCDELMERTDLTEPDFLSDRLVYQVRVTHLLGLMGIYGLWRSERLSGSNDGGDDQHDQRLAFVRRFCRDKAKLLAAWGEYAVPQWLAFNFYFRTIDPTPFSDFLYYLLIQIITEKNGPKGEGNFANPYYEPEVILPHVIGIEAGPLPDSFRESSFMLEGLMHLFARTNYKQHMKYIFPAITRIGLRSFVPEQPWHFYLYRNPTGTGYQRWLKPPHRWADLKSRASECSGEGLPDLLRQFPIPYLCFICVFPHRVTPSGLRWVSTRLQDRSA
jgi:hypothetical protein